MKTGPIRGWWYHGISDPEAYARICDGTDTLRIGSHVSDPGDLGRGVYLTSKRHEAKMYGHAGVLRVYVRLGNALRLDFKKDRANAQACIDALNRLYGSPVTGRRYEMSKAEDAWEEGGEIGPRPPRSRVIYEDRMYAASAWRLHLLQKGIDGIVANGWDFGGPLVLFVPERQVIGVECLTR